MTWQDIQGHDQVIDQFRRAAAQRRLASTFLFVGPPGVGKRTFAEGLAQALLCEVNSEAVLDPCGQCHGCLQVAAGTHPDLEIVGKPADKSVIPVETFIGDREHRNRQGLCHRISLKPQRGRRKVAIIDDADCLNVEGANCLLKTLEEPPPRSIIILISTSEQQQLPTIRSRSQVIRFRPLPVETVAQLLLGEGIVSTRQEAEALAELSEGSLHLARQLADPQLRESRQVLLFGLSDSEADSTQLAKTVSEMVDAAGKEAPARRGRMRQLIGWAAEYYRQRMRTAAGADPLGDEAMRRALDSDDPLLGRNSYYEPNEMAALRLQRCLDALGQVDANANQATLLECWIDDLVGPN